MSRLSTTTAIAVVAVMLALPASAQIARQGDRLVDLGKPAEQLTVTDGREISAADRQKILSIIADTLGQDALSSNGVNLPDAVEAAIVEGDPLPTGAARRPIGGDLADALAPFRPDGTEWVQAGEHLIAATTEGTAVMVLYDALN
ncbi:MAG: hypothetical protein AAF899_11090 [Pseudomonadota bacterium]